ncbi:MAG: hypothetical protein WC882_05385 [Candidatus Gracilibacteria bacterium]
MKRKKTSMNGQECVSDLGENLFDSLKFQALEVFLKKLKAKTHPRRMSKSVIEDSQYDFLERCDKVLSRTLKTFVSAKHLLPFSEDNYRIMLVSAIDRIPEDPEEESDGTISDEVAHIIETLEGIEDVTTHWLLAAFWSPSLLSTLYKEVESASESEKACAVSERLRTLFCRLIEASPFLKDEEKARLYVKVTHAGALYVLDLLNRFLEGHGEYAVYAQERVLAAYPSIVRNAEQALFKEAQSA